MQKFIPVVKGVRDRPKGVGVGRAGGPAALGVDDDGGDEVGDGVLVTPHLPQAQPPGGMPGTPVRRSVAIEESWNIERGFGSTSP